MLKEMFVRIVCFDCLIVSWLVFRVVVILIFCGVLFVLMYVWCEVGV